MSPKISPGPTKMSNPKRHGFGGDKKLRIAEHPKVQQCPLARGPFPGASQGSSLLGCAARWVGQTRARPPREWVLGSHSIPAWRVAQRGLLFSSTLILPPVPTSISIAFHSALPWQPIAPICLCPLPCVCLPGFAICLRLSLPP